MIQFSHTADNIIFIDDNKINISLTLKDFQTMEKDYELPANYTNQYYIQGIKWVRQFEGGETNLQIPWVKGDEYISKIQYYIDNKPIQPPTLEEVRRLKINEIFKIFTDIQNLGFLYKDINAYVKSDRYNSNELISFIYFDNFPDDFQLLDIYDEPIKVTKKQLFYINSKASELNRICNFNVMVHQKKINSFTTIKEIQDYDISTGCPLGMPWEI